MNEWELREIWKVVCDWPPKWVSQVGAFGEVWKLLSAYKSLTPLKRLSLNELGLQCVICPLCGTVSGGEHGAMGGWPHKQLERQVGKRARTGYASQGTIISGYVNLDQSVRKGQCFTSTSKFSFMTFVWPVWKFHSNKFRKRARKCIFQPYFEAVVPAWQETIQHHQQ